MKEKGFTPILLILAFLAVAVGAFYLGLNFNNFSLQKPQLIQLPVNSTQTSDSPQTLPTSIEKPAEPLQVSLIPTAKISPTGTSIYADYYKKLFPSDIPVYPGAKMVDYGNQGKCKAELLVQNSGCLQVMFIFNVDASNTSVEKIVNWYVSNPAPGWTYRGVYGDQRAYQFGDIYKNTKDVYYRLIYRELGPGSKEIEIDYNGPYPYSDLYPQP